MTTPLKIHGRDGRQILVQPPTHGQTPEGQLTAVDELTYGREIAKRVRTRSVSAVALNDRDRGRDKPTPVTYDTLRLMATRNEWARAIINRRKRQIAGKQWDIKLKDTDDASGAAAKAAKSMRKLLTRPMMHGSQPESTHWQQFIGMFLDDLLVLDRGCIEKERDGKAWIVALYPVDGATIRPNLDDRGAYRDDAYIQVVDGIKEATFGMEEMIVARYNPMTDVKLAGYGFSPLETLIVSVTADLHASKYNSEYFTKGSVPEGILSLGEDVDPDMVDAFRAFWLTEVTGKHWSLPIIGGSSNPEFINWRESNRDMQFMEYQQWLLQKMCAVFEIDQKDLGQIADVNRSTAESQDSANNDVGIQPLLDFIKHTIDLEIIGEHGQGLGDYLEFGWEQVGETADEINQKFQPMHEAGVATGGEWRDAHGMDADGDEKATHGREGLRMHLASGEKKPLPSHKDAETMGAHAEQQREDEMQQQGFEREDQVADREHQRSKEEGGQPSGVPWKPADDGPDTRRAMADHDRESGIGPRNVSKTHPAGHDRNPRLTDAAEDLTSEFTDASEKLVAALAEVLA